MAKRNGEAAGDLAALAYHKQALVDCSEGGQNMALAAVEC